MGKYVVDFSDADRTQFLELSKGGAIALFIYSANVLVNGIIKKYDSDPKITAIAKNGVVLVPHTFFSDFLGAKVDILNDNCKISLNEKALDLMADCENEGFLLSPRKKDGRFYIPVIDAVRALGFSAGAYYDDRLVIIGTPEQISAMDKNRNLAEAASYEVFGEFDATSFTSQDYKLAKDLWRLRLVGSPELIDTNDEIIANRIKAINATCQYKWDTLNKKDENGNDPAILWGDYVPTESVELSRQFSGIHEMANGYGTYGSDYYKNKELLADIIYALDWMVDHMYGDAEIANKGWRDVFSFNWWYWHVGGPEHLTDTLLIIEDALTMEQKHKYLKCYEWITTVMRTGQKRECASSRLKCGTKTALLLEDPVRLASCQADCDMLFGIVDVGEGIHHDYVQWTHGMPHNISYGLGNLNRTLFTSSILASTPLDFSGPKKYNQFLILKYTFEPAVYRGQGFMMFCGRSTLARERDYGVQVIVGLLPMIGVYGEDEDNYIKRMIKRHVSDESIVNKVKVSCTFTDIKKFEEILADDSIPWESEYEYAHAWFTGDRAAQHRNDYAVGIAMSSSREVAYESINSANKTGWYSGDGALYLYTRYDNGQFDGKNFIKNINIAYRYPGTTEDSQPRVIRSILNGEAWRNPTDFAGSMQVENKYLTCGMEFISMHFEGPDKNIVDTGYGGSLPVHNNDLVAKKAWFCFDDEIIALGSGITSTMNSPVHTTVDHRRIVDDEKYDQQVSWTNGVDTLPKTSFEKEGCADWVLMNGHAGYAFLDAKTIYVGRYTCEQTDNQDYFELRIEHGENPKDATYAYAILPYATKEKLEKYTKQPDVTILSNNENVQAVYEKNTGMTGYVFHSPCTVGKVTSTIPSIVSTVEKNGEFKVYVCDPTHKAKNGEFRFSGKFSLIDANENLIVECGADETIIKADFERALGKTYIARFRL